MPKLTEEQHSEIMDELQKRTPVADLAERYGVSRQAIYYIRNQIFAEPSQSSPSIEVNFPDEVTERILRWAIPQLFASEKHGDAYADALAAEVREYFRNPAFKL